MKKRDVHDGRCQVLFFTNTGVSGFRRSAVVVVRGAGMDEEDKGEGK